MKLLTYIINLKVNLDKLADAICSSCSLFESHKSKGRQHGCCYEFSRCNLWGKSRLPIMTPFMET